jgi:hypothetical protein
MQSPSQNLISDEIPSIVSVKEGSDISIKIKDGVMRFNNLTDVKGQICHLSCRGSTNITVSNDGTKLIIADDRAVTSLSGNGKLIYQYPYEIIQNIVADNLSQFI